jgi:hypothetical protein
MGIGDTHDVDRTTFEIYVSIFMIKDGNAVLAERASNFLRAIDVIMISKHSESTMGPIQSREDSSHRSGWHPSAAKWLHVDKITTEEDEIRTKRASFGHDAPKAQDIVGMRAGMEI